MNKNAEKDIKVYAVAHTHRHGDDLIYVGAPSEYLDVIDLAVHDNSTYEPQLEEENIQISLLPVQFKDYIHIKSLVASDVTVIPLATPEQREEYRNSLNVYELEMVEQRHPLRD